MSRPRSEPLIFGHLPLSKALRAACTARLMSSRSPSATLAITSPVAGLYDGNVLPDAASTNLPSINILRGLPTKSCTRLCICGATAVAIFNLLIQDAAGRVILLYFDL